MTKDEIKALISAKVAGQGDQVDAGGALAQILNGIIDAIPEPVSVPDWVAHVPVLESVGQITSDEYNKITEHGAVVYEGRLYTLCTDINTASGYVSSHAGLQGALYVSDFKVNDNEGLNALAGLTICVDSQGGYSVQYEEM